MYNIHVKCLGADVERDLYIETSMLKAIPRFSLIAVDTRTKPKAVYAIQWIARVPFLEFDG